MTQTATQPVTGSIRWMIRRDMPAVIEIETLCFVHPWSEEEFIKVLRNRNTIGMVADCNDTVTGFMVYELCKGSLAILNFAVLPAVQRRGIGRVMLDKLKLKLSEQRRKRIYFDVWEENLDGQLFLRANGFKCVAVVDEIVQATGMEYTAYRFVYRVDQ